MIMKCLSHCHEAKGPTELEKNKTKIFQNTKLLLRFRVIDDPPFLLLLLLLLLLVPKRIHSL